MNLYKNYEQQFIEMKEFISRIEEFGHIYEGYRDSDVKKELDNILESMAVIDLILNENYDI